MIFCHRQQITYEILWHMENLIVRNIFFLLHTVFTGFVPSINPFPTKPWFSHVCSTCLMKTVWEKEKLFVDEQFLFSSQVISPFPRVFSTHLENFLPFSSNLKLSSANFFSFEEFKICHLEKG